MTPGIPFVALPGMEKLSFHLRGNLRRMRIGGGRFWQLATKEETASARTIRREREMRGQASAWRRISTG